MELILKSIKKIIFASFMLSAIFLNPLTANAMELSGYWEGYYYGTDSLGDKIQREFTFEISDEVKENEDFSGIVSVDNGARYIIIGNIDASGNIGFKGTEWIVRPKKMAFAEFTGKLDYSNNKITGIIDSDEERGFILNKKQKNKSSQEIDFASLPRNFVGEYDGIHDDVIVKRKYEIHITNIDKDGKIKGDAIFSPSDKALEKYGANGSYYFEGTVDKKSGAVAIQGTEWISYPFEYENFDFVMLNGCFFENGNELRGVSEWGLWEMRSFDFSERNSASVFTLGRDNNSYCHTNQQLEEVPNSGFYNVKNYALSEEYLDKISEGLSEADRDLLITKMYSPWQGCCYGIAASIAQVFNKYVNTNEISNNGEANYFSMSPPADNKMLLNSINVYYLSQYLPGGKDDCTISRTFNNGLLTGLVNIICGDDSLSVFLQNIVNYNYEENIPILGFRYKINGTTFGHAIVLTDCKYNEEEDCYNVTVYDENSVSPSTPQGFSNIMKISKDCHSFEIQLSKKTITPQNFNSLFLIDSEKMRLNTTNKIKDVSKIIVSDNKMFELKTGDETTFIYDSNGYSGDLKISDVNPIFNGDTSDVEFTTEYISDCVITPLSDEIAFSGIINEKFYSIEGHDINEIRIENGIMEIFGNNPWVDIFISGDGENNNHAVFYLSGSSDGNIKLTKEDEGLIVSSDEMKNVTTGIIRDTDFSKTECDVKIGTFMIRDSSENSFTENKSESSKFLILYGAIAIGVILSIVFATKKILKKH